MNPFGAYVLGMSSTADPDVAAQVGASMYNNALQNQQQYDTKMQEMLMKQQDEQLKNQALANYLVTQTGMTPEEANAKAITLARLPGGFQNAALQNETGIMTPAQQAAIDARDAAAQQKKLEEDRRKEEKIQSQVTDLSKVVTKEDYPSLISAFDKAEAELSKYPQGTDIPGVGEIEGGLPQWATSSKGKAVRQAVGGLKTYLIHKFAGSAQSRQEAANVFQMMGLPPQTDPNSFDFTMVDEDALRTGMDFVKQQMVEGIGGTQAGYSPEVIDRYKEYHPSQAGVFEWAKQKGGGGSSGGDGLTPDEQAELNALREKYGSQPKK